MSENTAKLKKLRKEIEGCAESEAAAIVEAAEKAATDALAEAEKKVRRAERHSTRHALEKFRAEERKKVSEKRFSEGRRVLLYRARLADEFFAKVEAEVKAETEKPGYRGYLENSVAKAQEYCSFENAEVYCMEKDIPVIKEILSDDTVQVAVSDSITLGGIIVKLPEKNIIMDLSLDAALENERERFSSSKEMQL